MGKGENCETKADWRRWSQRKTMKRRMRRKRGR